MSSFSPATTYSTRSENTNRDGCGKNTKLGPLGNTGQCLESVMYLSTIKVVFWKIKKKYLYSSPKGM